MVVGSRFHGRRGALVGLAGLTTLPLVVSLTLAMVYTRYGTVPGVDAALRGVGAVAAGLAVAMGLRMAAPLVAPAAHAGVPARHLRGHRARALAARCPSCSP